MIKQSVPLHAMSRVRPGQDGGGEGRSRVDRTKVAIDWNVVVTGAAPGGRPSIPAPA